MKVIGYSIQTDLKRFPAWLLFVSIDIDELEKYIRTKSFRIALFRNKYSSLDTGLDHNREPTGGEGDGQLTFDEVWVAFMVSACNRLANPFELP